MTDFNDLVKRAGENNQRQGFNEYKELPQEFLNHYLGSKLMLVANELGEAQEELRTKHGVKETYYPTKDRFDLGNGTDQPHKPEGFPAELADAVIRLMGIAYETDIDLQAIIEEKMTFNESRPHKHGKLF